MHTSQQISIRFPEVSSKEAGGLAAALREALLDADQSVIIGREKENPDAQDMGTILTIVLGSVPAATIAAGIASFMRLRRVKVHITTRDKSIEVSGDSADAAKIIQSALTK